MSVMELNKTWNDYAEMYVNKVWDYSDDLPNHSPTVSIRSTIDEMIDKFFMGNDELDSPNYWLRLGALSVKSHEMDKEFVARTLCEKQNDYGPENIARFMHKGIILRLHDKVARLENLLNNGIEAKNEAIDDTYMDIVGYAVIGLMLLDNSFFYPLLP
tara:strand:- start:317 stop:790 length:474 start_codon:yes stop_codon:yes gene_type:complete